VIYIDETTFNFHMRNSRSWSYEAERVQIPVHNTRLSGVTLYGAIGTCLKHPVFMTATSTNSESFELFMESVAASIREEVIKPCVIIDNHRAHHSREVQSLFE
jgi:hypothetical protein